VAPAVAPPGAAAGTLPGMSPDTMATASSTMRRHGDQLRSAVMAAALEEIVEVGVARASMDSIAHRAGTGKATLYRRWPNAGALILDAIVEVLAGLVRPIDPTAASLREALVEMFSHLTDALNSPRGQILRDLIGGSAHDPAILSQVRDRFMLPRQAEVFACLEVAMERGEIPRQSINPYLLQVPAALIVHQLISTGRAPSAQDVTFIIDTIVMPLLVTPSS